MKRHILISACVFCVVALAFLMGSYAQELYRRNVHTDTASSTLTRDESGRVFTSSKTGILTWTLPTAEAGLVFTFIDSSTTAGDDIHISAASGDQIQGITAAFAIIHEEDTWLDACVTLIAVDSTNWVPTGISTDWINELGPA